MHCVMSRYISIRLLVLHAALSSATALADDIYVANDGNGTIGAYTTSGGTVNASLVSGLSGPSGIAVSGSDVFVANYNAGTIGEYTTSGGTVNASLFSGLSDPNEIAISGTNLFVTNAGSGIIGEYTTSGGVATSASR